MKTKFILVLFLVYMLSPVITYAGDINSYEQSIIDSLKSDINYNGNKYIANEKYITKITNYLMQDNINFSSQEASIYKSTLLSNIPACIKDGYLVAVDTATKSPSTTMPPEQDKLTATSVPVTNPPTVTPTMVPTLTATQTPTVKPTISVKPPTSQDINIHNSTFISFLDSYWSIFVIIFFIGIAITYILINKNELVSVSKIIKIISLSICLSIFISTSLIKFLFLNTELFKKNLDDCEYYNYIQGDISSYITSTYNFEQNQNFQTVLIKERFSTINIYDDVNIYNNSSTDTITVDTVINDIKNIRNDYIKNTDENLLPVTDDNINDWITNISEYYVNSINFSCAKDYISNSDDVNKYLNLIMIFTGITALFLLIYTLLNSKENMLIKLKCVVSSMLFTLPVLLGFIEYNNKNNLFSPTSGYINSSIHSYKCTLTEIKVFDSFNNMCINYFFYILVAYLILILATHFLVTYYAKK